MSIYWLSIHISVGYFTGTSRDLIIYNYLVKLLHGQDPIYKFVAETAQTEGKLPPKYVPFYFIIL